MPFLHGTQVSPLPLPALLPQLPAETEVWLISQTAEIFTDYESYANRYLFYSQPLFTPELPHQQQPHQPVSFFQALHLEQQHLDHLLQSNFPHSLKTRLGSSLLLPSAQLQPNIDHLVHHLYGLYHNRFDVDERVVVDLAFNHPHSLTPSLHDARVVRVFPPKPIRDLNKNSYSDLIHLGAVDRLQLDEEKCIEIDDANNYIYTIQLIHDQKSKSANFGASYMEVETQKLGSVPSPSCSRVTQSADFLEYVVASRHPDSFSKVLLKRFLQSVLLPHASTSSSARWVIHPNISPNPDSSILIPQPAIPVPTHNLLIKHPNLNQAAASKQDQLEPDLKKRKKNIFLKCPPLKEDLHNPSNLPSNLTVTCPPLPQLSNPKRQLKHKVPPEPIHPPPPTDCRPGKKKKKTLDVHSITPTPAHSQPHHNSTLTSKIPNPPEPLENPPSAINTTTKESKKSIKYPIEDLDLDPLTIIDGRYLRRVNLTPLKLPKKPQPLRQKLSHKFAQKLKIWSFVNIFRLNERQCRFEEFDNSLDDLTACLVKLILRQSQLRYPNTRPNKFTSISILPFFATRPAQECTVMSIDEREYWVRKGLRFLNIYSRCHKVPQVTHSSKKKPHQGMLEEDWVMGLVEIMCHRGGIERLGCMARILKYFFSTDATLLTIDHTCDEDDQLDGSTHPPQNSHSNRPTNQTNPQIRTLDFDGESPLTSNLDEYSEDGKSDASVEAAKVVEDEEPENGVETGDEDGRRYGRSIRNQRDNPRQLKKTLASRFEGLPVEDKLTLIDFLCELAMESDKVRNYMEECDEKLTVVRKEKADVNKEKRKVLEELARVETRKAALTPKLPPSLSSGEITTSTQDCEHSPTIEQFKSSGAEISSASTIAPSVKFSEASVLGSQHTNGHGPDQDTKPKLTQSKPISPTMGSSNTAASVDLPSKPLSPHIKANIKKLETPKQPSNRPLETHVRIATLTARQIRQPTYLAINEIEMEKQQLEKQLFEIGLRELQLQERFRQLIGVTKLKPLGVDRFYCKYWWFDGIGGMEIHSEDDDKQRIKSNQNQSHGNHEEENGTTEKDDMKWYSGCLFVSGPSIEDWDKMCESYGGCDQILQRRVREESGRFDENNPCSLDHDSYSINHLVGVDEWGIYETEDQLEELMNWLNAKGIRENNLKMNIKEWKEYITYGMQDRTKFLSCSSTTVISSTNQHYHHEQKSKDNQTITTTARRRNQDDSLIKTNGLKKINDQTKNKHQNDSHGTDGYSSSLSSHSIATDDDSLVDHLDDDNDENDD